MAFGITARAFRFYEDGTEAGATAIAAENANITRYISANSNLLLRYGVQESGSGSFGGATTDDYQLQVSKNGGAYANVTTSSTNIKGFDSANLTDAAATTSRLSAGTGSFVAGEIGDVDGLITDWQLTANNYSDLLFSITVVAADVANGNTLDFKVLRNGVDFNTYSVTPRITVDKLNDFATGVSTETDTALALSKLKIRATGVSTGTDSGLALGIAKLRAVSVSAETGTAIAGSVVRVVAAGLSAETGTALAPDVSIIGGTHELPTGLSAETDAAIAPAALKIAASGVSGETGSALALTVTKRVSVGVASETDVATARGWLSMRATETDSTFALAALKIAAVGSSPETDAALSLAAQKLISTGRADETGSSVALGVARVVAPGISPGTDAAFALSVTKIATVRGAEETDTALSLLDRTQYSAVGRCEETGSSLALGCAKLCAALASTETGEAVGLTAIKIGACGLSVETDAACALDLYSGPDEPVAPTLLARACLPRLSFVRSVTGASIIRAPIRSCLRFSHEVIPDV